MDVPVKAVTRDFVNFIDKNVKDHPGKSSLKFNIHDSKANLKLSLHSFEKGFTMNEEMVHFLEENKDVEVRVEAIL
jgi:DNA polymerase-3 subunit alpha